MKIGVLGSGQVGETIGRKLAALGHEVKLSSRHPEARRTALAGVRGLTVGSFAEAAAHGEWVVNALPGEEAVGVLGGCDIDRKILIDIGNYNSAVDGPIAVTLGEAIQRAFPGARVVKTLNSVSAHLMVDPGRLKGRHQVFIASNDADARQAVGKMLGEFGWQEVIDLGDLSACRAMEQLIPLWMRMESLLGGPDFNFAVVRE